MSHSHLATHLPRSGSRRTRPIRRGARYWSNLGLFALLCSVGGCLFFQYVAHPFLATRGYTHPKRLAVCCRTPGDYGVEYESVSIVTADGLRLSGWYIPSENRRALILLHPMGSNRVGMLDLGLEMARRGFGVLLLDLRAHGQSEGELLAFGGPEGLDVQAAAGFLLGRPDVSTSAVGVLGWSLGAQVAILGAAQTAEIAAVVADGPGATTFSDWPPPARPYDWLYVPYDLVFFRLLAWRSGVEEPMSVQAALAALAPRPVSLIGGAGDERAVTHLFQSAREPTQLWIIPEAGHIQGWQLRPEEYARRVGQFFEESLDP